MQNILKGNGFHALRMVLQKTGCVVLEMSVQAVVTQGAIYVFMAAAGDPFVGDPYIGKTIKQFFQRFVTHHRKVGQLVALIKPGNLSLADAEASAIKIAKDVLGYTPQSGLANKIKAPGVGYSLCP